jgi:outer membrane lipoprotein SlyB
MQTPTALVVSLAAFAAFAALAGCVSPSSGTMYSRDEARTAWRVSEGRVVDVKPVTIEGQKSWLGTAGGGFVGYELGRQVVDGSGRDLAGAVGSVVGAAVGQTAEERVTRQNAIQILVELESQGEVVAIVQASDVSFDPGERVRVLRRGDGAARVSKL